MTELLEDNIDALRAERQRLDDIGEERSTLEGQAWWLRTQAIEAIDAGTFTLDELRALTSTHLWAILRFRRSVQDMGDMEDDEDVLRPMVDAAMTEKRGVERFLVEISGQD